MATAQSVICIDPEIMSGTPVFAGTRVPVQALLDYLKAGDRIDDFLDQFPTVRRERRKRSWLSSRRACRASHPGDHDEPRGEA